MDWGLNPRAGLALCLVCLVVTSGCSSLLGEQPTSTLEWHTASSTVSPTPTPSTPTASPTFDAVSVANSHGSRLRSMAFHATLEVVTLQNGSQVGRDSVWFDREPGRLHYRLERSGTPAVMVGGDTYLGVTFERLSVYGEDDRVYVRAVGPNHTFVNRLRTPDPNDGSWATTNDTRHLGYLTERMVVVFGLVPEDDVEYTPTNRSTRVHWDGGTLQTPVTFAGVAVVAVENFSATIRDGVVRSYRITYVVEDDGTRYTIRERATFESGANFERPSWVPNGTATPADG